jgi:broad specificity phosphatase PhoE
MKLFFIRHGQTTGDVEDRYGSAYDDLLSPEGEQQAQALAETLGGKGLQMVYSSPLQRARQTAQVLASSAVCEVKVLPGLAERSQYGILTGMLKAEAKQQHPEMVEALKDRLNTIEGAESYADASARMHESFNQVVAANHKCAAVVWHGGGMRALFRDFLKMGELNAIGDCCWVELEKTGDGFVIKNASGLGFDFPV